MKIEIGQGEVQEIGLTLEAELPAARRERDVAALRTVDVGGPEGSTKVTVLAMRCLSAAKLASSSAYLGTSTPASLCRGALGEVGRDLHLAGQGEHVGEQSAN